MKNRIAVLFIVAIVFFQFASNLEAKGNSNIVLPAGTLDSAQLGELVFGNTVIAKDARGRLREIYFSPQYKVRQIKRNQNYQEGKWKIGDGRLCTTITGDRDCRIVVREQQNYRTYVVKKNNRHQLEEEFISINSGDRISDKLDQFLHERIRLPDNTLNAKEVYNRFSGYTVESVTAIKKRSSVSYYAPSGALQQERNGKKRSGKWRVKKDGRICLQMEDLPEKCRIIIKEGNIYRKLIVKRNGQHVHSVSYPKFEKGNPYDL